MLRLVVRSRRLLMLTLATALVATGAFAATGAVAAASPTSKVVVPVPSAQLPENGLHLTSSQVAQLNQSAGFLWQKGLWAEFSGTNGALTLKDPLSTLQTKYSLSSAQVQTIQSILSYDKQRVAAATTRKTGVVSPDISVNGLVIYFTFSDVGGLLITAASAGPWAMLAALDLVASMFGGPIGTVIGGILGLIGISTIGQIAYRTVQGYSMHKGVYFGFTFNWFWPNWVLDNWCGCN